MGYLLFTDALGIQNYYNQGVRIANPIIERIATTAKSVFGSSLPDLKGGMVSDPSSHLVVMNDSVFVYSDKLEYILYFASKFLKSMFIPERNVDPIAFRGAIAVTKSYPKIHLEQKKNISVTKIVIDNISSAMIAEKKKITGARILVPKALITEEYLKTLDIKYQYLLTDLEKSLNSVGHAQFTNDFPTFYDVAWMLGLDEKQEEKIKHNVISFWEKSVFAERSSLHASATQALFYACQVRKRNMMNVFDIQYRKFFREGIVSANKIKSKTSFKEYVEAFSSLRSKLDSPITIMP